MGAEWRIWGTKCLVEVDFAAPRGVCRCVFINDEGIRMRHIKQSAHSVWYV